MVATGFGRHQATVSDVQVTDLTAAARGAAFFFPNTRTILDVGGQTMKASRIDEVITLQEQKRALSSEYLRDYCNLRENARYVGANAPSHVDRLKRTLRILRDHADANFRALEAVRAVSHGLLSAIHDIARKKSSGLNGYTSGASMSTGTPGRTTAIAVDRAL